MTMSYSHCVCLHTWLTVYVRLLVCPPVCIAVSLLVCVSFLFGCFLLSVCLQGSLLACLREWLVSVAYTDEYTFVMRTLYSFKLRRMNTRVSVAMQMLS